MAQAASQLLPHKTTAATAHLHSSFRLWLTVIALAQVVIWRDSSELLYTFNATAKAMGSFLAVVFALNYYKSAAVISAVMAWFVTGYTLDKISARYRSGTTAIPGYIFVFTVWSALCFVFALWNGYNQIPRFHDGSVDGQVVTCILLVSAGLWGAVNARLFFYWKRNLRVIPRPHFNWPWKYELSKWPRVVGTLKWLVTIPFGYMLLEAAPGVLHGSYSLGAFDFVVNAFVLATIHLKWLFPGVEAHPLAFRTWIAALRRWGPKTWAVVALCVWVGTAFLINNPNPFYVLRILTLLAVLAFSRWIIPGLKEYSWAIWSAIAFGLVLNRTGSYHPHLDAVSFAAGSALAYLYWFRARSKYRQLVAGITLFVASWAFCSAGDMLKRIPPAELDPGRFSKLRVQEAYQGKQVGVALSGGGFRAGLVHAGALAAMEALEIPVTHVSGVSGGSITASYYTLGGPPEGFEKALLDHKFNLSRDLFDLQNLGKIVFSGALPGTDVRLFPWRDFTRTDVEAAALDRVLLREKSLWSLPDRAPKLLIATTDLVSGRAVGFTPKWISTLFLLRPPGEDIFPNAKNVYRDTYGFANVTTRTPLDRDFSLATLVSASSAFPLAFKPVKIKVKPEVKPEVKPGPFLDSEQTLILVDGGVTDNSGMTLLLDADWWAARKGAEPLVREWKLDAAIAIDGGAIVTPGTEKPDSLVSRAMDIIDSRGATLPTGIDPSVTPDKLAKRVLVSPSVYVDNSVLQTKYLRLDFGHKRDSLQEERYFLAQKHYFLAICSQIAKFDRDALKRLLRIHPVFFDPQLSRLAGTIAALGPGQENQTRSGQEDLRKMMRNLAWNFQYLLGHEIDTFQVTHTLKDDLDSETVETLYELGEDLMILNEPDIRDALLGGAAESSRLLTEHEREKFLCEMKWEVENSYTTPEPDPRSETTGRPYWRAEYESMLFSRIRGCSSEEIKRRSSPAGISNAEQSHPPR